MARYQINCKKYPIPELIADTKSCSIFASDISNLKSNAKYYHKLYRPFIKTNYRRYTSIPQVEYTREEYVKHNIRNILQLKLDNLTQSTACISQPARQTVCDAKTRLEAYNLYWDKIKLLTNPFERIYMTSRKFISLPPHNQRMNISDIEPLSRSFFKMIELGTLYLQPLINCKRNINTLHLAEGPGGFIEAWIWLRNKQRQAVSSLNNSFSQPDNAYAITLIDTAFEVPSWKRSIEFLRSNPEVHIMSGVDGTGNLYNIDNLRYLAERLRYKKIELVTADGGFDFSIGYNAQEYLACKLIFAEIIGAFAVLVTGGCFICKFFDLNNKLTADMMYVLQCHFRLIDITKPSTSRPANSEKYIVCYGFTGVQPVVFEQMLALLDKWNQMDNANAELITRLVNDIVTDTPVNHNTNNQQFMVMNGLFRPGTGPPNSFYTYLGQVNNKLIQTQIKNIDSTIDIIEHQTFTDTNWLNDTLEYQAEMARKWCIRFNIPYH